MKTLKKLSIIFEAAFYCLPIIAVIYLLTQIKF